MITYNYFLEKLQFPSQEEFEKIIKELPDFSILYNKFEFDPGYEDLSEKLFVDGFLYEYDNLLTLCEFDFKNKTVEITGFDDVKKLNELNSILKLAGWTLSNYDELVESFNIECEEFERLNLLSELKDLSTEQLKQILNDYKK